MDSHSPDPPPPIDPDTLDSYLQTAIEAARLGGEVLLQWLGKAQVTEKGPGDLVTEADFQSQSAISRFILARFPHHQFLGEEDIAPPEFGIVSGKPSQPIRLGKACWIVDPLDGTTNFVHQLRSFSVSIALCVNNRAVVGVVFDPTTDECFWASVGNGAFLNGRPIQPSPCRNRDQALVVFSMRSHLDRNDPQIQRFLNVVSHVSSFRRLGSAALNLCFVACGRIDAYWATTLQIWDVAAGWLIAQEAGAWVADFDGNELNLERPHFCASNNRELFDQLQPLLTLEQSSQSQ